MASSRYTISLKIRPYYPWRPYETTEENSILAHAWFNIVLEKNAEWIKPVTGQDHVSQTVMSAALKEFGGRITKEFVSFKPSGWMDHHYRTVDFKDEDGFSMFLLRYSH